MVDRTVRLRKSEVEDAQSAMRDLQVSIALLHRAGSGFFGESEPLVTEVRAACAFVQKVNDVLRNDVGQAEKYRRICQRRLDAGDSDLELVQAFRYVRHVISHRLVQVSPDTNSVIGGWEIGFRTYPTWADVPVSAHQKMDPRTQALKPYYDRHLLGQDVTDSLLQVARVYAELCPQIVHLDDRGEWTGFPLRTQPGVPSRVHPLEPLLDTTDPKLLAAHRRWLTQRRPGGDFRLIAGHLKHDGDTWVVGMTFRGNYSFLPFVESPEQVSVDAELGYDYFASRPDKLESVEFGPYRGGYSLRGFEFALSDPTSALGQRVVDGAQRVHSWPELAQPEWPRQVRIARYDYLVHRAERLYTTFPDW
jgi:hypothetical protein